MSPAQPRRAATVLCLRPEAGSLEVLLVRRSQRATFMADAYVFPGGRVDEADGAHGQNLATRVAALRELREEVGLDPGGAAVAAMLPLFSHWITPSAEPRRFDTDFFLCALPPGQTPKVDGKEVVDLVWLTPAEALSRYDQGQLKLPPPTHANLLDLAQEVDLLVGSSTDPILPRLLTLCAQRRPPIVLPKLAPDPDTGGLMIVLPWAEDFAAFSGEGQPLAPPAQRHMRRYVLTPEGRWAAH